LTISSSWLCVLCHLLWGQRSNSRDARILPKAAYVKIIIIPKTAGNSLRHPSPALPNLKAAFPNTLFMNFYPLCITYLKEDALLLSQFLTVHEQDSTTHLTHCIKGILLPNLAHDGKI